MNDQIQYYVLIGEDKQGPYTLTQLQAMWKAGSLTLETNYWFEGQTEWMPLATILELLEPPMPASRSYSGQQAYLQTPAKSKSGGSNLVRTVIFAGLGLFLIVLLIGIIANQGGVSSDEAKQVNYQSLTFQNSYFDVVHVLGHPDKEIEETEAPIPNLDLGYAARQWIVLLAYDRDTNSGSWDFAREKTHYVGIISTQGTVIHVADEKMRPLIDALAVGIKNQSR